MSNSEEKTRDVFIAVPKVSRMSTIPVKLEISPSYI